MNMNPMLMIDGYKLDHRRQYPVGTQRVYSNWTPRSCRIEGEDKAVFFGLQYFLKRYMNELMNAYFFNVDRYIIKKQYQDRINGYLGPNSIGVDHILALWDLGYVPLEFRALPEGTLCPLRVPCVTIENTIDEFFWLPNYFETIMSNILWKPLTSASTAWRYRKLLNDFAKLTLGDENFVQWQGHDFSFRGMSGLEDAMLSGAGHLLSFTGTDTIPALQLIEEYYPGDNGLVGGSVAATEHSVMSAGGQESELETFNRLLDLYPEGIVSVVSDTWDLWNVITNILPKIKDRIISRNGKLVIRPDSGDPVKILCGDPEAEGPAKKGVVQLLWEIFEDGLIASNSEKGFRRLDPHIGVIYGDAITYDRCKQICQGLMAKGFCSTNCVYGIGSFTYEYVTRDVYGLAMKATWAKVDGQGRDLFKQPITDDGTKFSAKGRLAVVRNPIDGELDVICQVEPELEAESLLSPVWRDGKFINTQSFKNIRETLWNAENKQ